MNKDIIIGGIAFFVIQFLISAGIFVKFSDMTAYAVSKDQFQIILDDLQDIKKSQQIIISELLKK